MNKVSVWFTKDEMKRALEASDVRMAIEDYERWLKYAADNIEKYGEEGADAIEHARDRLFEIFQDHGVSVWE